MASGGYGPVLRQLGRLLGAGGTATALGEGALLRRFAVGRDEAAFEALVVRHGPMVLGTCRRILGDPHDVDDAFQATFLVLARKAGAIRDGDRLGPWLHGVARRVATRSRALSARRAARERPGAEDRAVAGDDPSELVELRSALDEELARLPEKYRAPLVLCYLEGMTHDEAARQLGWPVGTVRSRMARGRDRLRSRLTGRGLSPSAAVPAIPPAASIPEALISATVRIATAAGSVPARVASLAKGAMVAMMWQKLKAMAAVGLLAGLAAGGVGVAAQQGEAGKAPAPVEPPPKGGNPIEDARKEGERLRAELNAVNRRTEQVQFERGRQLSELEAQASDLKARLDQQERRGKALVSRNTEAKEGKNADRPPGLGGSAPASPAEPKEVDTQQPKRLASAMELDGAHVLVIHGEGDRVTVLNTETGSRQTHRFSKGVTEITPIMGPGVAALFLRGPEVGQVAAFDAGSGKLYLQDLREPTKEAMPIVGPGEASYHIGRFFYIFNTQSHKWAVLELKRDQGPSFRAMNRVPNSKLIVPEGDLIHVYDPKTGELTHFDTKDEK